MPIIRRRYWIGSEGPYIYLIDTKNPIPVFRVESVEDAIARETRGERTGNQITVRRGESGREEVAITARRIRRRTGITRHDPITAEQYSAYRGAHAHSFNEVLIGEK